MYKLVSRSWSLREDKGGGRPAAAKAPTTHVPDEPLHGGPGIVSDQTRGTSSYNGQVTPTDTSKIAHQYASRPLPATPPSKLKMTDRPSTSGGSSSRKTVKNDFRFDKRVSRDDFYLGSWAYEGTRSEAFPPVRGQLQTPDTSPKTAPVQRFPSRTDTWDPAINSVGEVYNGDIGMALGSPTHPPGDLGTWNPQGPVRPRKVSRPLVTRASRSNSVDNFDIPTSRKPTGKWKLFGMFGRKQSDQSVPAMSISDPNGMKSFHKSGEEAVMVNQPPQSDLKSPVRSNTISSRKAPRHKPIVVRSQTMPLEVKGDMYDQKPRGSEKRGEGESGRIPIALDTGSNISPATGPLLNVEIPDVRLERYSVMFNSVLNSNPSLLTRRQATVQKLKSIEDAVERQEEERLHGVRRRATSPQPAMKTPGLGLFPTSGQGHLMPQKPSPRLRSNTSPALISSPSKAASDHATRIYKRPSIQETPNSKYSRHYSHRHPEKSTFAIPVTEQETVPVPHQFSNDQSHLVLDSPTDMDTAGYDAVKTHTWKPSSHHLPSEPKWQMISPSQKTPSTASSYTSSQRKRSPSLASSSRTHITRQSEDSNDAARQDVANYGGNKSAMTPVELSIARQISMSRQQCQLLQPLRTGGLGPSPSPSPGRRPSHASSPARTSPMTAAAVGENGRLAETKMATPTLVHPPETLDSHLALAQHRRSERVVLEGA